MQKGVNRVLLPSDALPAELFGDDGVLVEDRVAAMVEFMDVNQLQALVRVLGERDRRRTEEKGRYYEPLTGQMEFHKSDAKGRIVVGGNRAGKTEAGCHEHRWYCLGEHPYRKLKHYAPVRTRILADGWGYGVQAIVQKFKEIIPRHELRGNDWDKAFQSSFGSDDCMTLYWKNGSTTQFMSYDQKIQKMAGVPLHLVWGDEEMPSKTMFDENFNRLTDFDGDWYMTLTPVRGMTWIYTNLYLASVDNGGTDPSIRCFRLRTDDNKHLPKSAVRAQRERYATDATTQRMRMEGEFMALGGLVFPMLRPHIHQCDDFEIPMDWPMATALDPGLSKSHSQGWGAYDRRSDCLYICKELVLERAVPPFEWVKYVSIINGRHPLEYALCDPKWDWDNRALGGRNLFLDFQAAWPTLMKGTPNKDGIYYQRLRQLLEVEPISGKTRMKFFRNGAAKTFAQFQKLSFAPMEDGKNRRSDDQAVMRVDNDLVDTAGLIVTSPFDRYLGFRDGQDSDEKRRPKTVAKQCDVTGRITGYEENIGCDFPEDKLW